MGDGPEIDEGVRRLGCVVEPLYIYTGCCEIPDDPRSLHQLERAAGKGLCQCQLDEPDSACGLKVSWATHGLCIDIMYKSTPSIICYVLDSMYKIYYKDILQELRECCTPNSRYLPVLRTQKRLFRGPDTTQSQTILTDPVAR